MKVNAFPAERETVHGQLANKQTLKINNVNLNV